MSHLPAPYATPTGPAKPYPGPLHKAPEPTWSEDALQQECLYWLQFAHPLAAALIFHVPNGGSRSQVEGARFKAMGVRAGVPDLFLPTPFVQTATYADDRYGLFIELKTATGTLAPAQRAYHALLQAQGYRVEIIRSLAQFQTLIAEYLA